MKQLNSANMQNVLTSLIEFNDQYYYRININVFDFSLFVYDEYFNRYKLYVNPHIIFSPSIGQEEDSLLIEIASDPYFQQGVNMPELSVPIQHVPKFLKLINFW